MKKILFTSAMLFSMVAFAQKKNINTFPILDTCDNVVTMFLITGERLHVYRYAGKSYVCDKTDTEVFIMRREDISIPPVQLSAANLAANDK